MEESNSNTVILYVDNNPLSQTATILRDDSVTRQFVEKLADIGIDKATELPVLVLSKDQILSGAAVLNYLAKKTHPTKEETQESEVNNWISYSTTVSQSGQDENKVAEIQNKLNDHLSERTFLVSHHFTAADFAVYTSVHHVIKAMKPEHQLNFPNLVRWFDLVQHSTTGKSLLPEVTINLNAPLTAAPKKEAAAPVAKGGQKGENKKETKAAGEQKQAQPKQESTQQKPEASKPAAAEQPKKEAQPKAAAPAATAASTEQQQQKPESTTAAAPAAKGEQKQQQPKKEAQPKKRSTTQR
eukprot:TRINITY_DN1598_c0_g1_i1.p1 TRINITY_DN1598_c0_g1~~TRINITY_DN1598_c0_g1_i1.p1  ORF type:complete len:299 (+),score=117.24 TRINITY_DN1598_c0_g1_i1:71-967(+)